MGKFRKILKTFDLPHRKIEHILTAGTAKYNALTTGNLKNLSFRRRVNVFRRDSYFPEQVQGRSGLLWYLWSVWLARYRRVSNPNQRWQQLHGTHRTTGWMGRRFWRWRNVLKNWPTAVKFTSTHLLLLHLLLFTNSHQFSFYHHRPVTWFETYNIAVTCLCGKSYGYSTTEHILLSCS